MASTFSLTSLFSITTAYELVVRSGAEGGAAAGAADVDPPSTSTAIDSCCFRTSAQTWPWSLSAIALARTEGCAIKVPPAVALLPTAALPADPYVVPDAPKLVLLATQRPGSTQKTFKSTGSLSAGTMRSLPITRSCLPPATISPASSNKGRFELLIKTSRLTSAPSCCTGGPLCPRTSPRTFPYSVTTTSPERNPSSSVRNWPVE